jgi:hypothetical protein
MKSTHSNDQNTNFQDYDNIFDFETNEDFGHGIHDCAIDLRENKCKKNGQDDVNEFGEFGEFLRESGRSRSDDGNTFVLNESPRLIEISSNVKMIPKDKFKGLNN